MSFGFDRKKLTGATLALRILELSSMLLPLYVMVAVGYPRLLTVESVFSFLCRLGASLIPRVWLLGLGWLYKLTAKDNLLRARAETARRARIGLAAFLALEIVLHLLPLRLNGVFGTSANLIAAAVLALCLALTLLDLRAEKNKR